MGGSIRKELNTKATHLISTNAFGEKYRYALTFRLNVVRSSWVLDAWHCRNEQAFSAKSETFTAEHRLKIFEGCRVAFIGFPDVEKANMVDLLRKYNGIETSSDDETCTHKVSPPLLVLRLRGLVTVTNCIALNFTFNTDQSDPIFMLAPNTSR